MTLTERYINVRKKLFDMLLESDVLLGVNIDDIIEEVANENIKNAVGAWFGLNEWDEKSEYIAQKIISNKVYGSNENRMQARALKASKKTKHIKLKKVFNLIFPKYSGMCQKYKFLKKVPILLPFMWVFRWFQTLFTPSKIKARKKELDIVSAESINKYQSELEFVGLGFNFE